MDHKEMLALLMAVINSSGIWNGARANSHAFRLSPSTFAITKEHKEELKQLGLGLNDCLHGLSHIVVIANDQSLNYSGSWKTFRKVASTGVPGIEAMLRTFIKPKSLELVRSYIPETYLVGQQATTAQRVRELVTQKNMC